MMLVVDPDAFIATRRQALLAEADAERLAAQLPRRSTRHALAVACYRLADWLDAPGQYLRANEPGAAAWGQPSLSV